MPKLIVVTRDGTESEVDARVGWSVMENIRENGFDELLALCGGCCSCATCHVQVGEEWLDRLKPIGPDEDDLLDTSSHRGANSRLSCQIMFEPELDGLRVRIAPED
ncbi:MAG: 2Fe-2S iron-sulfur cluster-binding protein [Allosphingosinicella sp.]|uniref:2Fe-2S iron-sulfur cluster-binding protein n=1 Tax=Allosphingosinicella sp. TaxID=2823234 RepID=UPI00395C3308